MSLFKAYTVDKAKAAKGIPVPILAAVNADGTIPTFYVRRLGPRNAEWAAFQAKFWRAHPRALDKGYAQAPEELRRECSIRAMAEIGVVGWENVQKDDGTAIPFSILETGNILAALPELLEDLESVAFDRSAFAPDDLEAASKN